MSNRFHISFENLPKDLPIFPLSGVLLLPRGNLPLNIFEERYLNMVDDAMRTNRLIGMIQPQPSQKDSSNAPEHPALYDTGCAGKITSFEETPDGRYLINLTGICRFKRGEELSTNRGYRKIAPDWTVFQKDLEGPGCMSFERSELIMLLQKYFAQHGLSCDWDSVESASDDKLLTALSMICPLQASEKQALLEAKECKDRADLFVTILEMAIQQDQNPDHGTTHH